MIQSNDLLKAIETAIPATAIEQAISLRHGFAYRNKQSQRRKKSFFGSTFSSLFDNSNEPVVDRLNAGCTQKLSRWSFCGMGKSWQILASSL
jgi:hypothetical protein